MYRFFVGLSVVVGLAGCASTYSIPTSIPSADIFVTAANSPSGVTGRNIYLWAFKDEQCTQSDHGTLAGRSHAFANSALAASEPQKIPANDKFVFTAGYIDSRFAQNRQCTVTAAFVPEQGHLYRALIQVDDDVTKCGLGILDVTGGSEKRVAFAMPKYACLFNSNIARENGKPLWTNYVVRR